MSTSKTCSFCHNPIEPSENTPTSEQTIKENIIDEVKSIDYLLREVPAWRANNLIHPFTEQELFRFYGARRQHLIQTIYPQSQQNQAVNETITNPTTTSSVENTVDKKFIIKHSDKLTSDSSTANNLELDINLNLEDVAQPSSPLQPSLASVNSVAALEKPTTPIFSNPPVRQNPPRRIYNYETPQPPPQPTKNLGELISENINYIFAACAALFVGGIALYYRNELYHGLTQPITQAVILMLLTLGFLISGVYIARKTSENIAGRTLTLVGALLVPINPWFLVRSHLIADTGRGWVLGIFCTLLYISITYFLKDPLFVYLSLVTGMITTWVGVYLFSNHIAQLTVYAVALITYSILSLITEQIFRPAQEGVEFSREKFGRPFFHFAQVGIAITLLFYTPLIAFLPQEFIAAKEHFDPSYSSLMTACLALAASFAYGYSGAIRRASYFIYLSIGAIYWSEISLFIHLKSNPGQAMLIIAATTFALGLIAQKSSLEELFKQPMSLVATIIGNIYIGLAVIFLMFSVNTSWSFILAFLVVAVMFQTKVVEHNDQENIYRVSLLGLTVYLLALTKLALDKDFYLILLPLPAVISLALSYKMAKAKNTSLSSSWQYVSLFIAVVAVYKLIQVSFNQHIAYSTLAIFFLEITLIVAAFSYLVEEEIYKLTTAIISGGIFVLSYSLMLADLRYLPYRKAFIAYAILVFAYYALSQTSLLWDAMKQALSYLSTAIAGFLALLSLAALLESNMFSATVPVVLALVIITSKELWHLYNDRDSLQASLLGSTLTILLAALLVLLNVTTNEYFFLAEIFLAFGYLVLANKLSQKQLSQISVPFDVLANLIVAISALGLLFVGSKYNLDTLSFSPLTTFGYITIVGFYVLATVLSTDQNKTTGYSHATFSVVLMVICLFGNYFGLRNWADLAVVLTPVLIGYIFLDRALENTKFSGASLAVAQVAQPIVMLLGIWSGLFRSASPLSSAFFFAEFATFYLCLGLLKKQVNYLYVSIFIWSISLWKVLAHFDIAACYLTIFYAIYGAILLYLADRDSDSYDWTKPALYNFGHSLLAISSLILVGQTFVSLNLSDEHLSAYVVSLLTMVAIFAWVSVQLKDENLKTTYKNAAIALSGVSYLTIGIRLGFSLLEQTEFYSLPIGIVLFWAGYDAKRKSETEANLWFSSGSLLWVLPTLLHVMRYRFIVGESSTSYDFLLILLTLVLMIGGILTRTKSVTTIGQAGFIIELAIIVFSAVKWEQQGLSVLMILLAVAVFISAWTIHYYYKRNKQTK